MNPIFDQTVIHILRVIAMVALGLPISVIDIRTHSISRSLLLIISVLSLGYMLLFRFSIFGLVELMVAVAISIAIKALFLQSIGMGDILLLIVFAMLFELEIWLGGLFFTGICSLLAGLLYRTVKRVDIRPSSKIAFAPFLFGGFTLAALLIPSIL